MTLACIDRLGHIILVLKRKKGKTFYIGKPRNKRTVVKLFNREFNNTFLLIADEPVTIAKKWLASPIKMTEKVKEELEMIVGLKNNKIVGKYESADQAAEGVELVCGIEDLSGRSLKSLNALYKKITGSEDKFTSVEEASSAIWTSFSDVEVVKEKKEKAPREKMELVELPKNIGKESIITGVLSENPRREGTTGHANFSNYVVGETLGQYLAKEGAHMGHFRWDVERGFITADIVEDVKEPKVKKVKEAPAE